MEPAPVNRAEVGDFAAAIWGAFHSEMHDDERARWEATLEPERTLAIRDRGQFVAGAGIFSRRLTVPGGEVPAAAVTLVGVRPTHRRRGLMSTLMRRQLNDVHEAGREPVAALWPSEPIIYGRFGYGLATMAGGLRVATYNAELRTPSSASYELLAPTDALPAMRDVFDAVRPSIPGMIDRDGPWWDNKVFDPEHLRDGAEPMRAVVTDGAYALYSVTRKWDDEGPKSEVAVHDALAVSPEAETALWTYLLGLDLVRRLSWELAPSDHPLPHMVTNTSFVQVNTGYALFVRVVDLPKALTSRTYAEPFEVVLEVADDDCPWNAGRWALRWDGTTATCARTATPAGLELGAAELGAAYLGGTALATLARAGRVRELRSGALASANRAFRGDRDPWCPEVF